MNGCRMPGDVGNKNKKAIIELLNRVGSMVEIIFPFATATTYY